MKTRNLPEGQAGFSWLFFCRKADVNKKEKEKEGENMDTREI